MDECGLAPDMPIVVPVQMCTQGAPRLRWESEKTYEETIMKTLILNSLNRLHNDEAGQGLVEYLLIIALVAFAACAGMTSLASGLNSAFTKVSTIVGQYIT